MDIFYGNQTSYSKSSLLNEYDKIVLRQLYEETRVQIWMIRFSGTNL